jgi:2-phospho-L-lactate guanylyltransferase
VSGWSVLIPLKPVHLAKSRFVGRPHDVRRALVIAMAQDVKDAVLACSQVDEAVVVSADRQWQGLLAGPRVRFHPDRATDTLNGALKGAAAACRTARPARSVAALPGDVPALLPEELDRVLETAAAQTFFVPDASGEGTTLFAARSGAPFQPRYGVGSRLHHRQSGALEVGGAGVAGLRQDVDTVEDLQRAWALGLGFHTRTVASVVMGATSCRIMHAPS